MANVKVQQQLSRVLAALNKADKNTREAVRVALYQEFVDIMRVSLQYVPVDTGLLRSTAYVTLPTTGANISIKAGYGTSYGLYVHENDLAKHKPPTKDHFWSDPLELALPSMKKRLAERTKKALEQKTALSAVPSISTAPKVGVGENGGVFSVMKMKKPSKKSAPAGMKKKGR